MNVLPKPWDYAFFIMAHSQVVYLFDVTPFKYKEIKKLGNGIKM